MCKWLAEKQPNDAALAFHKARSEAQRILQKEEKERLEHPPPKVSKSKQQSQRQQPKYIVMWMKAMVTEAIRLRKAKMQDIANMEDRKKKEAWLRENRARAAELAKLRTHPDKYGTLQLGKAKAKATPKTKPKAKTAPFIVEPKIVKDEKDANKEAKQKKDKKDKKDKTDKKENKHKDGKEHKHGKEGKKEKKKKEKEHKDPPKAEMKRTS